MLNCRHALLRASLRLCPWGLMMVGITGCAGSGYPADWPPLSAGSGRVSPRKQCPDLSGAYVIQRGEAGPGRPAIALGSTFLGAGPARAGVTWQRVSVSGDAEAALVLRFEAKPAGTEHPAQEVIVTALNGDDYTCRDGWLVAKSRVIGLRVVRQNVTHPDIRYDGYRAVVARSLRFRRDVEGALVAQADVRESRVLSLWAETGAGVPYWFDTVTYWTRWGGEPAAPSPATDRRAAQERALEMGDENGAGIRGSVR